MGKKRDSGVELLRFTSIFLIMVAHIISLVLGGADYEQLHKSPVSSVILMLFDSISVICVDVFVVISGWYGIHATTKGVAKLIFQCFFFGVIGYCVSIYSGAEVSVSGFIKTLFDSLFPGWFIAAYIVLYVLSSALNGFVENNSKSTVIKVLTALFVFIFAYGWIFTEQSGNFSTFISGYSAIFLLSLYLLTRFIKTYYFEEESCIKWKNKSITFWGFWWIGFVLFDVAVWTITTYLNIGQISSRIFLYTSPFVIAQAICMFKFFQLLKVKSRIINYIGASSLAIMLIHYYANGLYFKGGIEYIYGNYNGPTCILFITAFLLLISVIGILIDQIRLLIWKPIESKFKWTKLCD